MNGKRTREHKSMDAHSNTDRWLLTYADLITLLLGLFVILYAMSEVDRTRYSRVMQALGGVFGEPVAILPAAMPVENAAPDRIEIESRIRGALYEDLRAQLVSISQDDRGVVVHLAEELLFASGSAELKRSSLGSLDLLTSVLKTVPNEIRIEGHTDDVPIATSAFPSNWHLSVARAVSTGEYMMHRQGLDPGKVTLAGYADQRPLVPNTSTENRAKNRRVDILVLAPKATTFPQQ